MSEKRFTIGRESNFREEWYAISCDIKDGDEFIFVGMPKESAKFVVDKLNEQQDTISQLQDLCGKSDYENAKLRLKNKELQDKIDHLCEKLDKCKMLNDENEQLRKELNDCEKFRYQVFKRIGELSDE